MFPPSKYSPEFDRPWKPENNTGCCAGCHGQDHQAPAAPIRIGCVVRYQNSCASACGTRYSFGSATAVWRSC